MTTISRQSGFSLIEALVAMLILAVASAGLIRASEAHIDSVRDMERRTAAAIVAQNRLAELNLPGATAAPTRQMTEMLGEDWVVSDVRKPTGDPDLIAVTISVRGHAERDPLVSLDGFVDMGSQP